MIWLLRHSERFAFDEDTWTKSKRYKINKYDTPLKKETGEKIVINATNKIINNDKNIDQIDYIYCSPMTRTIQTAIFVQKQIKKKTGRFIPIRIEYGLKEMHVLLAFQNMQYNSKTNKYSFKLNKKETVVLDSTLNKVNLNKKYKKYIDNKYKSLYSYQDTKYCDFNYLDGANRVLKTIKYIDNKQKNKNYIVVSHCISMINMIPYFTKRISSPELQEKIYGKNWCSLLGINKNKIVYSPLTNS
jgi:broad specificity phosphatase PhoE